MSKLLVALTMAVVSLAGMPAQPRLLAIDFVALDKNGLPVPDLKPGEIEVWIGQFRAPVQRMTVVSPEADERGGRIIVLLLDDMTLRLDAVPRAREAARRFVTQMGAGDRMAIVTLAGTQTEATDERAKLFREIDRYSVRAAPVMRSDTLGRHILDTLASIAQPLVEVRGRRKTIVGIGNGRLLDRPLPNPIAGQDLLPEWVRAMRELARANVNFYVIDPSGLGSGRADGGDEGFARETGGHAFLNTNDLNGTADRILRESGSFYIVDVPDPPVGGKADLRPLEVKSLRKGVTIRARHAIPGSY